MCRRIKAFGDRAAPVCYTPHAASSCPPVRKRRINGDGQLVAAVHGGVRGEEVSQLPAAGVYLRSMSHTIAGRRVMLTCICSCIFGTLCSQVSALSIACRASGRVQLGGLTWRLLPSIGKHIPAQALGVAGSRPGQCPSDGTRRACHPASPAPCSLICHLTSGQAKWQLMRCGQGRTSSSMPQPAETA